MIDKTLSHYRIVEKIGAGGMGEVYKAHDERLDRDVAIKVLPSGTLADEKARKRFRKEALALSKLNHPNIATVFDFDTQDGRDFIVMEYVEGASLAEKVKTGPLSEKEISELGAQIADALDEAHERGIVHRDLKPGNIAVTPKCRVKVLDFGLARMLRPVSDEATTEALTQEQALAGTLPYMSPEELRGERADHRSDMYSFGVVLYEMAAGRRPFEEKISTALANAIINKPPEPPSSNNRKVSPGLENIIVKAMDKDPEHRYQSARDLRVDLERLSTPVSVAVPKRKPVRASRWLWAAACAVAVIVTVFLLNVGGLRDRLAEWPGPRIDSIAVLPLENLSGDPDQEYFADGMTEALTAELGQLEGVRVISRTSVMMYKDARKPLPEIAQELDVDAVVEGSVLRSEDRVRITAQLVRVVPEEHLWAHSYERDYGEVLALQSEIALAIAREIKGKLTQQTEGRLTGAREVDQDAYEAYLKGRYYINQRTTEGFERSREYFQQAIDEDPTYAPAYTGLAQCYVLVSFYGGMSPKEHAPLVKAAIERAMRLDDRFAEAHQTQGILHYVYDWKWFEAEREFKRALELNPNYASGHLSYSSYLASVTGRVEDAAREIDRALEIDPLLPLSGASGGLYLFLAGDLDRALSYIAKALELAPDYPMARWVRGLLHEQNGALPGAVE